MLSTDFTAEPVHEPKLDTLSLCGLGATYPKHPPLEFLVGHVLVGVTPCGRCAIVALLPQITKLPKKS